MNNMSRRSIVFLASIAAAILAILVLAIVAAVSFNLGKQSATVISESNEAAVTASQSDIVDQNNRNTIAAPIVTTSPSSTAPENTRSENSILLDSETKTVEPSNATTPSPSVEATPTEPPNEILRSIDLNKADLDLLLEVWNIIAEEFDGQLPVGEDITYRAIDGSLELLNDRFTRFVPPTLAETLREQLEGSFEGIGAFVDLTEDGFLVIVRPIQGQPADLAGVESGDFVIQVDGQEIQGMSLDEIIAMVKGPKGSEVTLTIIRENRPDPFDVTITRDLIELPIVESEMIDGEIAYVRLTSFSSNSANQLNSALEGVLADSPKGLIIDLRDNPGGFLSQSVEVADLFLPKGIVLYQRDSLGNEEIFESDDDDIAEAIPLVVLVNAGSASASEIVAGAIQDRDRGILIGETTFGKGSVQHTHTLSDGSELRVTVARWYTPDNQSISEQGVVPDIFVETPDLFGGDQDTQLQRAIEYLLSLG